MQRKIKDIYLFILKKLFFNEFTLYKKLISTNFKEINHPTINCFNSDDLYLYIDIYNNYGYNDEIQKEFSKLIIEEEYNSTIDLKCIDSISNSKSKSAGYEFDTIYSFGKNIYIDKKCKWTIDECIEHISDEEPYDVYYYTWNNRYKWSNGDGSHHFAVANFLLTNENMNYNLNSKIRKRSIDISIAQKLLCTYYMFVVNSDHRYIFNEYSLIDTLKSYDIGNGNSMILIYKENIDYFLIEFLIKFNQNYIFYFNNYLIKKLKIHTANLDVRDFH